MFYVTWDAECKALLPKIAELAPVHPAAIFLSVRADDLKLRAVARDALGVKEFPTFVLLRNGVECGEAPSATAITTAPADPAAATAPAPAPAAGGDESRPQALVV